MNTKYTSLLKKLFLMHNLGFDYDYVIDKSSKGAKLLSYSQYKAKWLQFGTAQKLVK
jgi:hypothetical protein